MPDFHNKDLQVQWEATDAVLISLSDPKYLPLFEAWWKGKENKAFGDVDVCASCVLKENTIPVLLAKSRQSLLMQGIPKRSEGWCEHLRFLFKFIRCPFSSRIPYLTSIYSKNSICGNLCNTIIQ